MERNTSLDAEARNELIKRNVNGVPAFLINGELVVGLDTQKIESLLQNVHTRCGNCNANLRLPKGKGKLKVTCPKCKTSFEIVT